MVQGGQSGQAGVETLGVAAALIVAALAGWQVVVGAYAWQTAQSAARSAARAAQVGAPVRGAALTVMPRSLAMRARVVRWAGGETRVVVAMPEVLPGLGGRATVTGSAGGHP